jgi:low affinity Fe/Cu permease
LVEGVIMNHLFRRFAQGAATAMGSHWAFAIAAIACLIWALTGPAFDYSNTWQLVINTATTVMTFLAVFLIQNTQNRNSLAVQLKLDELLRAVDTARTSLVDLEDSTDEEIEKLRREFQRLHELENTDAKPS